MRRGRRSKGGRVKGDGEVGARVWPELRGRVLAELRGREE